MPGPWLTDAEIKTRVASILELAGGAASLPPFWDERVARCHASAWKAIRSILMGRGYTAAQLDTWDEREEYEGDVSAAFVLRDGVADTGETKYPRLEGHDQEGADFEVPDTSVIVRHLDRRPELYTLTLVGEDGLVIEIEPEALSASVGFGTMRSDDVFREPCCPPCSGSARKGERSWYG